MTPDAPPRWRKLGLADPQEFDAALTPDGKHDK